MVLGAAIPVIITVVTEVSRFFYGLFRDGAKDTGRFLVKQSLKKSLYFIYFGLAVFLDILITTWILNSFEFIPYNGSNYSAFGFFQALSSSNTGSFMIKLLVITGVTKILTIMYYIFFVMITVRAWQRVFNRIVITGA